MMDSEGKTRAIRPPPDGYLGVSTYPSHFQRLLTVAEESLRIVQGVANMFWLRTDGYVVATILVNESCTCIQFMPIRYATVPEQSKMYALQSGNPLLEFDFDQELL